MPSSSSSSRTRNPNSLSEGVQICYLVFSSLTILFNLIIIICILTLKKYRKHPNDLLFWLCFADLGFTIKFMLHFIIGEDYLTNPYLCYGAAIAGQGLGVASISWNFIVSLNLYQRLRNPFVSTKSSVKFYHMFVWGLSVLSVIIMLSFPRTIGSSGDGTCWIDGEGIDSLVRLSFFVPLLTFIVFAGYVQVYAIWKLRKGLPESILNRYGVMLRQILYTVLFFIAWLPSTVMRFLQIYTENFTIAPNLVGPVFVFIEVLQVCSAIGLTVQGLGNSALLVVRPDLLDHIIKLRWRVILTPWCLNCFRKNKERFFSSISFEESRQDDDNGDDDVDLDASGGGIVVVATVSESPGGALVSEQQATTMETIDVVLRRDMIYCIMLGIHHNAQVFSAGDELGFEELFSHYAGYGSGDCLIHGIPQEEFERVFKVTLTRKRKKTKRGRSTTIVRVVQRHDSTINSSYDPVAAAIPSTMPRSATVSSAAMARSARIEGINNEISRMRRQQQQQQERQADSSSSASRRQRRRDDAKAAGGGSRFVFTDYAPMVFREIRKLSGITSAAYKAAFDAEQVLNSFILENFSEGRSGSFFCRTKCNRFIIKTVSKSELKLLLNILPNYFRHLKEYPNTLITRFYGLHEITMYGDVKIRFVVMSNVFETGAEISTRYDLKGSWVNRKKKKNSSLLMDEDVKVPFYIERSKREQLVRQLEIDSQFFAANNIMDYSVLVGVHYKNKTSNSNSNCNNSNSNNEAKPFFKEDEGGMLSEDRSVIYFVGIIDLLQAYNFSKKAERFLKVVFKCKDKNGLSSIGPHDYAARFQRRMGQFFQTTEAEELHTTRLDFYSSSNSNSSTTAATDTPITTSTTTTTTTEASGDGAIPQQQQQRQQQQQQHQPDQQQNCTTTIISESLTSTNSFFSVDNSSSSSVTVSSSSISSNQTQQQQQQQSHE